MFNDTIRAKDMQLNSASAPLKFDFTIHPYWMIGMYDMCTGFDGLDNEEYADKLKAALLAMLYLVDTIEGRLFALDEQNTRDVKSVKTLLLAIKYSLVKVGKVDDKVLSTILKAIKLETEKMDAEVDSFNIDITNELEKHKETEKEVSDQDKKEQLDNVYNVIANTHVEDAEMNEKIESVSRDNIETILLNMFDRIKNSQDKTYALYKASGKRYDSWDWDNNAIKVVGARKAKHFSKVRGEALSGDTILGIIAAVAGDPRFMPVRMGIFDSIMEDNDRSR